MHEYHLAKIILDTALKGINTTTIKKITKIFLEIGVQKMITSSNLQETFNLVARDSLAEGAALEIEETPDNNMIVKSVEIEKL